MMDESNAVILTGPLSYPISLYLSLFIFYSTFLFEPDPNDVSPKQDWSQIDPVRAAVLIIDHFTKAAHADNEDLMVKSFPLSPLE